MKPEKARSLALSVGFLLIAAGAQAAPCSPSATALCLAGQRFQVEVRWKDFQGNTGSGRGVGLTPDTGYFWFFSDNNIELVVKVLDGRALNNKFWVFFGALSNVEYTLKVTDTVTGATKSYQNPSGQFASVGDTSAFAGAGSPVAIRETSIAAPAEGTAAAAPCLGPSTKLGLANCRFLVHVDWRDSRGGSGEGHAVQITKDTGYFWFFSDNNVELIVKVLDARVLNGNFWVFYGALSDVAYDLTVTDMLTGVVKSYHNPAGAMASVGDTAAFTSGTSVAAVKDDSRAVSAVIDERGGTLAATARDGSFFRLEIPPDAIGFSTRITMTPLEHIDAFPFSGGAKAGVQLEPEGLFLWVPAILTIQAATAPPDPAARVTFGYRGGGDEFVLVPRERNSSQVRLHVSHFSGYGEGVAISKEQLENLSYCEAVQLILQARAKTITSRRFDSYIQRTMPLITAKECGKLSPEDFDAQVRGIWEEAWNDLVFPALERLADNCEPAAFQPVIELAFEYLHVIDVVISDIAFSQIKREIVYAKVKEVALKCIDKAYERCKSDYDPTQSRVIMDIVRILQKAFLLDDAEYALIFEKVEKCLRFEVSFDTFMTVAATGGPVTTVEQFRLTARVPVRLESSGSQFILSGEATLNFGMIEGATGVPGCTVTYTTTPGTFQIDRLTVDDPGLGPGGVIRFNAAMVYRPGDPQRQPTIHCKGGGEATLINGSIFTNAYKALHKKEFGGNDADPNYVLLQWDPVFNGPLLAKKEYSGSTRSGSDDIAEDTTLLLKHTPE